MQSTWIERETSQRDEVVRLGVWMFLATVAMLFAAFASAYLVRRGSTDWAPVPLPSVLWLNTLVLTLSSLALEVGYTVGLARRWTAASGALGAAVALGTGFLGGQVVAWQTLVASGVVLPDTPYASFLYVLTGAHALHVLGALALLAYAAFRTWQGLGGHDATLWRRTVEASRTCWHFLLGIWAFVLLLLSF